MREGDALRRGARRYLGRAKLPPTAVSRLSEMPNSTKPAPSIPGKRKRRRRKGSASRQLNTEGPLHMKRMKKLVTPEAGQGMEPMDAKVSLALSNEDTYVSSDIPLGYKPWTALPDPVKEELAGNMKGLGIAITRRTIRAPRGTKLSSNSKSQRNRNEKPCLAEFFDAPAHKHAPIPEDCEDYLTQFKGLDHIQQLELTRLALYEDFEVLCRSLIKSKDNNWWKTKTCGQIAALFQQTLGREVHQYFLGRDPNLMYISWNLDVDRSRFYGCLSLPLTSHDEPEAIIDPIRVWETEKLTGPPACLFFFPCICQKATTTTPTTTTTTTPTTTTKLK